MGEIRTPFRAEWVFPLGTAVLEDRTFPVPADPDALLAATYGAGWRVPDPAFHFETPRVDPSPAQRLVPRHPRGPRGVGPRLPRPPAPAAGAESDPARSPRSPPTVPTADVVDLGCGRGADACWLGEQGAGASGSTTCPRRRGAAEAGGRGRRDRDVPRRSTSSRCGRCSTGAPGSPAHPRPGSCSARHLVDACERRRRQPLALAGMLLRDGGRLPWSSWSREGNDGYAGRTT